MSDLRLSLGDELHSKLDCLDCQIGCRKGARAFCSLQAVADATGVRQGRKRPFFCSAMVPRRCTCGLPARKEGCPHG